MKHLHPILFFAALLAFAATFAFLQIESKPWQNEKFAALPGYPVPKQSNATPHVAAPKQQWFTNDGGWVAALERLRKRLLDQATALEQVPDEIVGTNDTDYFDWMHSTGRLTEIFTLRDTAQDIEDLIQHGGEK
jgi:hypothetical protein